MRKVTTLANLALIGLMACGEQASEGTPSEPGFGDNTGVPAPDALVGAPTIPGVVDTAAPPIPGAAPAILAAGPRAPEPGNGPGVASPAGPVGDPANASPVTPAEDPANALPDETGEVTPEPGVMPSGETPEGALETPAEALPEVPMGQMPGEEAAEQPIAEEPTTPTEEAPAEEPEPVTFQTADGTIPNSPQPESLVGIPESQWRDGLVSPTLLEGHQINQPVVINGYLVVTGNEDFWIYDVSDPTSPQELSSFSTPNRRAGGEAEGHTVSFARYGDTFYMVTIGGTGIDTWDVTDPTSPQHVGNVGIPGTNYGDYTEAVWGVSWQGQYIYVGATNNGVKVVDAADPADLNVVAEVPTSAYGGVSAGPVDAIGNVLVVMTPKESGGVATLDISDPTNPTRLASLSTSISYIGQFYRRWVFLIGSIRAWDVLSDPRNIGVGSSPVGQLPNDGAEYLSFSDNYLYLGHVRAEIGGKPGASKINVTDPSNMRVESRVWGRMDRNGLNDDQFNIPLGNLLVLGDDQAPYAGWVIAVHASEPDSIAPVVDTVIPKDATSDNSTTSRIGLSMTDNIDLATVNAASFIVRPVGGEPLPGRYGVRMSVVNFDPDEDLEPGTTYEVVIPAGGMADLVGNTIEAEFVSTFTTN